MPGFDRTGPNGEGAFTGRGQGNCGEGRVNSRQSLGRQQGMGRMGMGRRNSGFGGGRGFGAGRGFGQGMSVRMNIPLTEEEQMAQLKILREQLKAELDSVDKQIGNN